MNITSAELADLHHRQAHSEQPRWRPGVSLVLCLRGNLENPLNATWGWRRRRSWATRWKERVFSALLEAGYRRGQIESATPKLVVLEARVWNLMDSADNLRASLKPVVDALVEAGVLDGDADRCGHRFDYRQRIARRDRGLTLTIQDSP